MVGVLVIGELYIFGNFEVIVLGKCEVLVWVCSLFVWMVYLLSIVLFLEDNFFILGNIIEWEFVFVLIFFVDCFDNDFFIFVVMVCGVLILFFILYNFIIEVVVVDILLEILVLIIFGLFDKIFVLIGSCM